MIPRTILSTLGLFVLISQVSTHVSLAQYTREYAPWPVLAPEALDLPFWGGINDPKPSLADLDGDGRIDLFLGEIRGKLSWLRNTGTPLSPAFEPVTQRLGGLDIGTWHTFCDIDADGDLDLFGDSRTGQTSFWRNESDGSSIHFVLAQPAFGGFETGQNNTCTFADIDADGDHDFFFGNLTGTLTLYRNIGDSATPEFVFETDTYDSIIAFPGGLGVRAARHGFSTIRYADVDGDLDLDLFYGDIFNFNIYFFENTGSPIVSALVLGTESFLPAATLGFNHTAFADLDADLDLDLVVGAANGQDLANLQWYRNDGSPEAHDFVMLTTDWVRNIDVGSYSVPEFGDLDGDGDWDLLIGRGDGRLTHFENTGLPTSPLFVLTSNFYADVDVGGSAAPELVDWDADGDLDLLVGTEIGTIEYWRNEGDRSDFVPVRVTGNLGAIKTDRLATPRAADLNGDGLKDLVVGEWDFNGFANVRLYQNLGPDSSPVLSLIDFALLPRVFRDFTLPQVTDWDGDGRDDLVVGDRFFGLSWFRNGSAAGAFPDSTTLVAGPDTLAGSDDGYRLALCRVDIDSDGDLDIFVGEEDGGVNFYRRDGGTPFYRGDANASGVINSADIIYLVNFIFKAGPIPIPVTLAGDADCLTSITSADIIYLVNFVFKAGPAPCAT